MKRFLLLFFVVFSIITYSQENNSKFNLPPGYRLQPKKKIVDLSYKLNSTINDIQYESSELRFLKQLTENELESLRENLPDYYNYLQKAKSYINSLTPKVKSLYTEEELWYIYAFDPELKNKLTTI